jgi:hypothetical protein
MKDTNSLKHDSLFTICYNENGEMKVDRYKDPVDAQRRADFKNTTVISPNK